MLQFKFFVVRQALYRKLLAKPFYPLLEYLQFLHAIAVLLQGIRLYLLLHAEVAYRRIGGKVLCCILYLFRLNFIFCCTNKIIHLLLLRQFSRVYSYRLKVFERFSSIRVLFVAVAGGLKPQFEGLYIFDSPCIHNRVFVVAFDSSI